jgi:hypothetical protein
MLNRGRKQWDYQQTTKIANLLQKRGAEEGEAGLEDVVSRKI